MSKSVLFYVSGHGFGHAVRSAEVIRALLKARPEWSVHVRTRAPAWLFELERGVASIERVAIDGEIAEREGGLLIDHAATLEGLRAFAASRQEVLASEVDFIRRSDVSLIVADVPYLAGEIAGAANIPCVAIANFTWDWIFEPLLEKSPDGGNLVAAIQEGYAKMQCWLRLPFSHANQCFPKVTDVPLVARQATQDPQYVLQRIGIASADTRPRVLVSSRGPISPEVFRDAVQESPDVLFLHVDRACRDLSPNTIYIQREPGVEYVDIIQVCQAIISKLGYGILADCIACGSALLFPPRRGFREDQLLQSAAATYLRAREIPAIDFRSGRWGSHVQSLLEMPSASATIESDGAEVCAGLLASYD